MKWPSARVVALPTSWSSPARRSTGRSAGRRVGGAQRVVERVARQRLRLRDARGAAASSGSSTASSPRRSIRASAADGGAAGGRPGCAAARRGRAPPDRPPPRRRWRDRLLGRRVRASAQPRREPHRAHQAQGVLAEAFAGARRPRAARRVRRSPIATVRVDERPSPASRSSWQPGHGVDREVAPSEVVGQRHAPSAPAPAGGGRGKGPRAGRW